MENNFLSIQLVEYNKNYVESFPQRCAAAAAGKHSVEERDIFKKI